MSEIFCREASNPDLAGVLRLYAQPDMDDGKTIPVDQAEPIFDRMKRYPDYKIYVSISEKKIVGTRNAISRSHPGNCILRSCEQ